MINTRREYEEVVLLKLDAHPCIIFTPYVKISSTIADVTYLLVLM